MSTFPTVTRVQGKALSVIPAKKCFMWSQTSANRAKSLKAVLSITAIAPVSSVAKATL